MGVHVLADQRRAPAVGAVIAGFLERADAALKKVSLEGLDMGRGGAHPLRVSPRRVRLLPAGGLFARCPDAGKGNRRELLGCSPDTVWPDVLGRNKVLFAYLL